MTDAFGHQLRLDQIRDGERLELTADEAERNAIARRLGLESLSCLEAHAALSRSGDMVRARGRLAGSLEQACVVTGEPFDLVFVPEPPVDSKDEEIELGESDLDVMFHDGSRIDLGGAIADTLALSLDPYPRSASADAALKEAGVMSEAEASPFAALAKLRKNDDS